MDSTRRLPAARRWIGLVDGGLGAGHLDPVHVRAGAVAGGQSRQNVGWNENLTGKE